MLYLSVCLFVCRRRCGKDSDHCAAPEDWERSCNHRVQLQSHGLEEFTHTLLEGLTHTPLEEGGAEEEDKEVEVRRSLLNPRQGGKDCLCRCGKDLPCGCVLL